MLMSGIILPISRIILHKAINNDSDESIFVSMAFHNVSALIFLISSILHLRYHWRTIKVYIKNGKNKILCYPRELFIAGGILLVLLSFALHHVLHQHL